ncbi:MAG TPA: RNA polymerase sigma factor [Ignavibacteriales bacterium]|nr:RNA polymerase sigma factor [Ignavibacteriales bacterium]
MEFKFYYAKHKSKLYFYVFRMLNDKMLTDDIVQNVFIKLYENMDNINNREFIASWIYKTARNKVYSFLRHKKRKAEELIDDEEPLYSETLTDEMDNVELREMIMSALETIPEEQREAYLLKEYSGFSYKEIASLQDIDEELVKSRLFHARKKLIAKIAKVIL